MTTENKALSRSIDAIQFNKKHNVIYVWTPFLYVCN